MLLREQGVRDKTALLCLLEQAARARLVRSLLNHEPGANVQVAEAERALHPVEHPFGAAVEVAPRKARGSGDGPKRENETVHDGCNQECLGGPTVAGASELGRRRRAELSKAARGNDNFAFGRRAGADPVAMGQVLHGEKLTPPKAVGLASWRGIPRVL